MNLIQNESISNTIATATLPAGKYWIGDLSQVMEPRWDVVCNLMFDTDEEHNGMIEIDGLSLWFHPTGYGDGIFKAKTNTLPGSKKPRSGFSVDAGLIGIVPFELTDASQQDYSCGMTVTLSDVVTCTFENDLYSFRSGNGVLVIDAMPKILRMINGDYC